MHCYYAQHRGHVFRGPLLECLKWASAQALEVSSVIKVLKARSQEKSATIILEVTVDGVFSVNSGRHIPVEHLERAACHG